MKTSSKALFLLLSLLLLTYNISYADINDLKRSLNKNIITTSEIEIKTKPPLINVKTNLSKQSIKTFKIPKKNENPQSLPKNTFDNSPTIYKNLKIKVNGKEQIIRVPFLNEKFMKKQNLQPIPKRISEKNNSRLKTAPIRIGDGEVDISLMPCPFKYFDFPVDEKDELRKQAIADVQTIFNKVNSLTWENYGQTMQEIYKLTYETIYPKSHVSKIEFEVKQNF